MSVEQSTPKEQRTIYGRLLFLDCLFILTLIIIPFAWILDPLRIYVGSHHLSIDSGIELFLVPTFILVIRLVVKGLPLKAGKKNGGFLGFGIIQKGLFSLCSLYIAVGLAELCLVLSGFEIQMAPVIFSIKDEAGVTTQNKGYSDPELRWKFTKGQDYYGMRINSLGYRDREVEAKKGDNTLRVISLGDSCTAHGMPPYSTILNTLLSTSTPTANKWEAFNMAVYGYSSMQGLRMFQLQGKTLEPDIVTIYFGWNDHWLEMETDSSRMAIKTSQLYGKIYNLMKRKRLFMMATKLSNGGRYFDTVRSELGFRVPPEDYKKVITEIIKEVRSIGAYPIVMTAPRRDANIHQDKYGTDIDYNVVHDQYVQMTRDAAKANNADIIDLYSILEAESFDDFFKKDGIHLKQPGIEFVAQEIDSKIREITKVNEIGNILSLRD